MNVFKEYIQRIGWWGLFDLLLLLAILVGIIVFFKKKRSLRVMILIVLYVIFALGIQFVNTFVNNDYLLISRYICRNLSMFFIVTLCVVYQSDLKMIVSKIAASKDSSDVNVHGSTEEELLHTTEEIIKALVDMSKNDIGALIILCPTTIDNNVLNSGTELNALLSSSLLESVFNPKTPLHDGAVIVKGNTILAAGCFLPLTTSGNISKDLGTRHRAAKGITEESDVVALVVSEESGIISCCQKGELTRYMTIDKLREIIRKVYGLTDIIIEKKK